MGEIFRKSIDVVHRQAVHRYLTNGEAQRDREIAHERALVLSEKVQHHPRALAAAHTLFSYKDPLLQTEFAGVTAPNGLGMAAGYDKDLRVHRFLGEGQGFGSVSGGGITRYGYEGNVRPRIHDLPESDGIANNMSFPGQGVALAEFALQEDAKRVREYILFLNLGASKPSFEKGTAIEDYIGVATQLRPYGDVHEINVSSPNTDGVRALQEPEIFLELAAGISAVYGKPEDENSKPFIFKFSPDLERTTLLTDITIAIDAGASGISLSNTSTDPELKNKLLESDYRNIAGGISGAPLREKAMHVSHIVSEYTDGTLPIKYSGGIQTAEHMWQALTYGGATIVDVYSAYVRPTTSTPNFARYVLSDLARGMRALGMESMKEFSELRGTRTPFPKTR